MHLLTGCGGWIRVLCQTPTGHTFLRSKLLRGVWQRGRHDERRWIPHVLLPGSVKTFTVMPSDIAQNRRNIHARRVSALCLCPEDPEALREEGKVPVRWCKFWSACHPTPHHPSPQEEVNVQPWLSPSSVPCPSLVCRHGNPCNSPV